MAENTSLRVADIIISDDLQPREGIDQSHAADIAEVYRKRGKPQIKRPRVMQVTDRDDKLYALDQHRVVGAKLAGRSEIPVAKLVGTWQEARDLATSANTEHTALKRSLEAKQRAVDMCLEDHPDWTDGRIAKHTQTSHTMVAEHRPRIAKAAAVPVEKRTGLDGRTIRAAKAKKATKPTPAADDPDRFQPILSALANVSRQVNDGMNTEGGEKLLAYLTHYKLVSHPNKTIQGDENTTPEPKFRGFPILAYIVRAAALPGRIRSAEELKAMIEKWKEERQSFTPQRS